MLHVVLEAGSENVFLLLQCFDVGLRPFQGISDLLDLLIGRNVLPGSPELRLFLRVKAALQNLAHAQTDRQAAIERGALHIAVQLVGDQPVGGILQGDQTGLAGQAASPLEGVVHKAAQQRVGVHLRRVHVIKQGA